MIDIKHLVCSIANIKIFLVFFFFFSFSQSQQQDFFNALGKIIGNMSLSRRLCNSPGTAFSLYYEPFKWKKKINYASASDRKGSTYLPTLKNGGNMQQKKHKEYSLYQGQVVFLLHSSQVSVIVSCNFSTYDIKGMQPELVKDVNLSFTG